MEMESWARRSREILEVQRQEADERFAEGRALYRARSYVEAQEALQEAERSYAELGDESRAAAARRWLLSSQEAARRERALRRKERIVFVLSLAFIAVLWGAAMCARRKGDHGEEPHPEGEEEHGQIQRLR